MTKDYGRKPYYNTKYYLDMMRGKTAQEMYALTQAKHSELLKPYRVDDDYQEMENTYPQSSSLEYPNYDFNYPSANIGAGADDCCIGGAVMAVQIVKNTMNIFPEVECGEGGNTGFKIVCFKDGKYTVLNGSDWQCLIENDTRGKELNIGDINSVDCNCMCGDEFFNCYSVICKGRHSPNIIVKLKAPEKEPIIIGQASHTSCSGSAQYYFTNYGGCEYRWTTSSMSSGICIGTNISMSNDGVLTWENPPSSWLVSAEDKCGKRADLTVSFPSNCINVTISGADAPLNGSQYTVSGGTPPYTWSITKATITCANPPNCTTATVTNVTGKCGVATITATDSCGHTGTKDVRMPGGVWIRTEQGGTAFTAGLSYANFNILNTATTRYNGNASCLYLTQEYYTVLGCSGTLCYTEYIQPGICGTSNQGRGLELARAALAKAGVDCSTYTFCSDGWYYTCSPPGRSFKRVYSNDTIGVVGLPVGTCTPDSIVWYVDEWRCA